MRLLTCRVQLEIVERLKRVIPNIDHSEDFEDSLSILKIDKERSTYGYTTILLGLNFGVEEEVLILRRAGLKTSLIVVGSIESHLIKKRSQLRAVLLNAGADDCLLIDEIDIEELIASIHASERRAKGQADSVITVGPIVLNLSDSTFTIDGQPRHLAKSEFAILAVLARSKERCVSRETIVDALHGSDHHIGIQGIPTHIKRIRQGFDDAYSGSRKYLVGVYGRGYVLTEHPENFRKTKP